MDKCSSIPKQKRTIIQNWLCLWWCMVGTHTSVKSTYFGKRQWSVKDTIAAMSNSLWSTLKNIGINLVPIRPPNPLLHPFVHDYPITNVFSFTSRLRKENKRKEEIYLSRTVLLLTFTFSLMSELSRGFAPMPVCYGVKGLFCLFWLVLFLMLSSAFILFIVIPDLICMHSDFFFFLTKD